MSRVRPLPARERPVASVDPEALVEEARRRTRRRRAGYAAVGFVAMAVAISLVSVHGGGRRGAKGGSSFDAGRGLPPAARVVGTQRVPSGGGVLFAARGGTLYEAVPGRNSVALARVDPNGRMKTSRIPFDRAGFLMDLSAGREGMYAGTAVIERFANVPDELLRIDPQTLAVRARASFPSRVAAVEQGKRMWISLGDGRVLRLDPRTLAVEATRRLLSNSAVELESSSLSKPAVGLGSVWVLAGDGRGLELVRMDPASLAIRSRTRVTTAGRFAQALNSIVADAHHVYLVGRAVAPVAATGRLRGRPVLVPGLQTAGIHSNGLVGVTFPPALELLTPTGAVRARTRFLDAGAQIVVNGRDAWFLGSAGRGNGIVHVRLRSG